MSMKVCFCTMVYERLNVFEIFCLGIERNKKLLKKRGIDTEVVVIGSNSRSHKKLCDKYGYHYYGKSNSPLGSKFNESTKRAKKFAPDYIISLGSDDIIGDALLDSYIVYMNEGIDHINVSSFYMFDMISKQLIYWKGYQGARQNESAGIARCVSKRICDLLKWQLWDGERGRGLDGSMSNKLRGIDHTEKTHKGYFSLDIKDDLSVTPFRAFYECANIKNARKFLEKNISKKEVELLYADQES